MLREYVYISTRKVAAVPPRKRRWWSRVRKVELSAGNAGAGIELADQSYSTRLDTLREAEQTIRAQGPPLAIDDPGLKQGHWISSDSSHLVYGIPARWTDGGNQAVVFTGTEGGRNVLLCGSAEHLLDRSPVKVDPGSGMSAPEAIDQLLWAASDSRLSRKAGSRDSWGAIAYPYHNLHSDLSHRMEAQPMAFLARVTRVVHVSSSSGSRDRETFVLASPLFVALTTPQ